MRFVLRALVLTSALATSATAQTAVPMQAKPLDPANLDRSVSACTDFYQFANGGWIKRNPIPPAYSRWGSFDQLQEGFGQLSFHPAGDGTGEGADSSVVTPLFQL